ncbi:hypothetical protein RR46_10406 [Papilio xuthus]|uniref:Uncharacterized protein n=1 Tax=Papilio xuthus TaxID=66420 RepID=A0A194Q190_PAPXU|nr:hypothetical protein RR46_10406 [Papilio xuthus]
MSAASLLSSLKEKPTDEGPKNGSNQSGGAAQSAFAASCVPRQYPLTSLAPTLSRPLCAALRWRRTFTHHPYLIHDF